MFSVVMDHPIESCHELLAGAQAVPHYPPQVPTLHPRPGQVDATSGSHVSTWQAVSNNNLVEHRHFGEAGLMNPKSFNVDIYLPMPYPSNKGSSRPDAFHNSPGASG
jgi:hypothetical protein